jgi:hypothetical protein
MITMAVGIVIFGVLTSFLAQSFMRAPGRRLRLRRGLILPEREPKAPAGAAAALEYEEGEAAVTAAELRALREEVAAMRRLLETRLAVPPG